MHAALGLGRHRNILCLRGSSSATDTTSIGFGHGVNGMGGPEPVHPLPPPFDRAADQSLVVPTRPEPQRNPIVGMQERRRAHLCRGMEGKRASCPTTIHWDIVAVSLIASIAGAVETQAWH